MLWRKIKTGKNSWAGQGQVHKLEFYELGLGTMSPSLTKRHLCEVLSKAVGCCGARWGKRSQVQRPGGGFQEATVARLK